jgi:hypothetical protein
VNRPRGGFIESAGLEPAKWVSHVGQVRDDRSEPFGRPCSGSLSWWVPVASAKPVKASLGLDRLDVLRGTGV